LSKVNLSKASNCSLKIHLDSECRQGSYLERSGATSKGGQLLLVPVVVLSVVLLSGCTPPPGAGEMQGKDAFFKFLIETVTFVLMAAFIYYWLVTRPAEMKELAHGKFLKEVKKGDQVILKSGMLAKVHSVSDDFLTVEIASNVKVKVESGSVQAYDPEKKKDDVKSGSSKDKS